MQIELHSKVPIDLAVAYSPGDFDYDVCFYGINLIFEENFKLVSVFKSYYEVELCKS
jgi:hypothetical protein